MSIIGNIGGQSGGGSLTKSILIVTAPTGSTVTVTKGGATKTATEKNGEWWFKGLGNGEWTIRAELDGQSATEVINITQFGVYRKPISYRMTPEFTYTGDYEIVQDDDTPIEDFASWKGNWKIRFLTSDDFAFTKMHEFSGKIDVFLVGGGGGGGNGNNSAGGGGGGGYTKTQKNVTTVVNTNYSIVIGGGGSAGNNGNSGGATSAFSITAPGGKGGEGIGYSESTYNLNGGDGGSGGAGYTAGHGGTNGSNGASRPGVTDNFAGNGGKGQGTTTREFGEDTGKLYSGGGSGGGVTTTADETAGAPSVTPPDNRGGGGGGSSHGGKNNATNGASGIVIIRNARGVAQ